MSLSRLAEHGHIEPVARGVFRAAGAPSIREEDVYAAWLATDAAMAATSRERPPCRLTARAHYTESTPPQPIRVDASAYEKRHPQDGSPLARSLRST